MILRAAVLLLASGATAEAASAGVPTPALIALSVIGGGFVLLALVPVMTRTRGARRGSDGGGAPFVADSGSGADCGSDSSGGCDGGGGGGGD